MPETLALLSTPALLWLLGIAVVVMIVAAARAGFARLGKDRPGMRTADAARVGRQTRRIRAGQPAPAWPLHAQPALRSAEQQHIARVAAATAAADYRWFRRHSANPHTRGTRAYALWSLEYAAAWQQAHEEAEQRAEHAQAQPGAAAAPTTPHQPAAPARGAGA